MNAPNQAADGVVHVVPGPDDHGIVRHALGLLTHAPGVRVVRLPDGPRMGVDEVLTALPPAAGVHLHLNDELLGDTPGVVEALAERCPTSVTLHDVPSPAEGAVRYTRRRHACTRVLRSARLVVVASEHERQLLGACLPPGTSSAEREAQLRKVFVVPLPLVEPMASPVDDGRGPEPVVAVLGFVYPGKGHAEAIEAASGAGLRGVLALGTVAQGHEDLVEVLARQCHGRDLSWELTGYLDDEALVERAQQVAVPLAHHAHLSASGSIGSWIAAGRRPLVSDGPWVRELLARCPGVVRIIADPTADVRACLLDPGSTWLAPGTPVGPTPAEAWAALDRLLSAGVTR